MKILGIDLGERRTGTAISDASGFLASPYEMIETNDKEILINKIKEIIKDFKIELIVVGYPKNMNGSIGERAEACKNFAEKLEKQTNIKTVLWDERCTTLSAIGYLNTTNTRGKKRKKTIDSLAASIILQDYLDYLKNT